MNLPCFEAYVNLNLYFNFIQYISCLHFSLFTSVLSFSIYLHFENLCHFTIVHLSCFYDNLNLLIIFLSLCLFFVSFSVFVHFSLIFRRIVDFSWFYFSINLSFLFKVFVIFLSFFVKVVDFCCPKSKRQMKHSNDLGRKNWTY